MLNSFLVETVEMLERIGEYGLLDGRGVAAKDSPLYEIRVKGRLNGDVWSDWFEGMILTPAGEGETILWGAIDDQAALFGLLCRLRDLALPLLSVNLLEAG
jgi:hypothetical protein